MWALVVKYNVATNYEWAERAKHMAGIITHAVTVVQ
jgi:hypothetical protein